MNQRGQTLVIIVLVMLVALSLGITISTRYFNRLRNITQTDSASRAIAVAEAAVEKILLLPNETLENYVEYGNCGSDCTLQITGSDGVAAVANVTLSYVGNSSDPVSTNLAQTSYSVINLEGYGHGKKIWICWNSPPLGELPSVTGLYYFKDTRYEVNPFAYNSIGSPYTTNGFSEASANYGYQNCFSVTASETPYKIRLKSIYNETPVVIIPSSGEEIPLQGFLIESTGNFAGITKKVKVIKSDPILPNEFDYTIYSKSESEPLSK